MEELHIRLITGVGLGLLTIGLFFLPAWVFVLVCIGILIRILVWEWPRLLEPNDKWFWIIMPFYPILPIFLMIYMQLYGYDMLNLMLITLVGAHDSGAYLVGKEWGTHPISPSISPKKSWEGFAAGVGLSFIFSLIFFGHNPIMLIIGSIIPFVVSLNFAVLAGDLFESTLKRNAGLKDAGTMLSGHGGILDRIDGLLFAAVIVFLARNWLMLLLA